MPKTCKEIIQEILTEATKDGGTITEPELIKRLDAILGFWEQAEREDFPMINLESESSH